MPVTTTATKLPVDELGVGLAASIGPLPHVDPVDACRFVLAHQPRLPAAPSLPNRSVLENRIPQAAWGIEGVRVQPDGSLELDLSRFDPARPFADAGFSGEPYRTLHAFLDATAQRTEPIKLQLLGPLSLGVALLAAGVPAQVAFKVAGTAVRTRAAALVQLAAERAPGAAPVVFLEEPALCACMDPDFPMAPDDALDLVSSALATVEHRAVTGLWCPAEADWRLVLQAGPQILGAPADARFDLAGGAIGQFLERGGWVAWGAVPTDKPLGLSAERLWKRLAGVWCELVQAGCDPAALRTQAMITPAGGLAQHGASQAELVMRFTTELANRLHDQATGVALSVGA
ncbi:MAG: hypothetical protein ACKVWR_22845 [Acidimicrobiales bacterium]